MLWHNIRTCPKYLIATYLIGKKVAESIQKNLKKKHKQRHKVGLYSAGFSVAV